MLKPHAKSVSAQSAALLVAHGHLWGYVFGRTSNLKQHHVIVESNAEKLNDSCANLTSSRIQTAAPGLCPHLRNMCGALQNWKTI